MARIEPIYRRDGIAGVQRLLALMGVSLWEHGSGQGVVLFHVGRRVCGKVRGQTAGQAVLSGMEHSHPQDCQRDRAQQEHRAAAGHPPRPAEPATRRLVSRPARRDPSSAVPPPAAIRRNRTDLVRRGHAPSYSAWFALGDTAELSASRSFSLAAFPSRSVATNGATDLGEEVKIARKAVLTVRWEYQYGRQFFPRRLSFSGSLRQD